MTEGSDMPPARVEPGEPGARAWPRSPGWLADRRNAAWDAFTAMPVAVVRA